MTSADHRGAPTLKRDSLGIAAIVFFVVAAAAPLAASVATAPVVFAFAGVNAPLAYVAVGAILLLFSFGYARMSQNITSAAGLAAFVEAGLGRRAGLACAAVAVMSYGVFLMGLYGGFGYIASYILDAELGLRIDPYVCAGAAWLTVAILGYRAVELNVRILGVLLALEIAVLVVFDVVSTIKGGADGISLTAFDPSTVELGSGFGIALLFAAVAFVGFEATAIYGEEAKSPKSSVARATYAAVLVIAGSYALTMWVLSNAYGTDQVVAVAIENPAGFVPEAISTYLGAAAVDVTNLLVVTSYFAAVLASHNTLSRYLMSIGRAKALPSRLAQVHPTWRSPHVASATMTALAAVVVLGFAVSGTDPFVMFSWLTGLGTLGIFVVQGAAAAAIIGYFWPRNGGFVRWSTFVAPLLALVGIVGVIILGLRNWDLLSGATSGWAAYLPWLVPVAAVVGLAVSMRQTDSLTAPSTDPEALAAPLPSPDGSGE